MYSEVSERARALLGVNGITSIFAYSEGELGDWQPELYTAEAEGNIYSAFCGANLSKSLLDVSCPEGCRVLVLLKPCDSRSFELLARENRLDRNKIYALGVPCRGMLDREKLAAKGIRGNFELSDEALRLHFTTDGGEQIALERSEVLLDKCVSCRSKEHIGCDEVFLPEESLSAPQEDAFAQVEAIEKMSGGQRFEFWRRELSRCIRCNACRNACPACSCVKCIFDNPDSSVETKANAHAFEEQLFHIVRSLHVAGRCVDCGECSRVCPEKIPLSLLCRKTIKDIAYYFGEQENPALLDFDKNDPEPSAAAERSDVNA